MHNCIRLALCTFLVSHLVSGRAHFLCVLHETSRQPQENFVKSMSFASCRNSVHSGTKAAILIQGPQCSLQWVLESILLTVGIYAQGLSCVLVMIVFLKMTPLCRRCLKETHFELFWALVAKWLSDGLCRLILSSSGLWWPIGSQMASGGSF